MNPETFNAVQPLLDKIAELAEKQLDSEELRRLISELGNLVGKGRIASVNIVVDVFDEDREGSLPLAEEYRPNVFRIRSAAIHRDNGWSETNEFESESLVLSGFAPLPAHQ